MDNLCPCFYIVLFLFRLLGGDNINDIIVILLDDLERTFESEEETLSTMVLKVRNLEYSLI